MGVRINLISDQLEVVEKHVRSKKFNCFLLSKKPKLIFMSFFNFRSHAAHKFEIHEFSFWIHVLCLIFNEYVYSIVGVRYQSGANYK